MLFGLTVSVFGISMLLGRQFPTWLGGLGTVAAGVAQAYTGFSALAMERIRPLPTLDSTRILARAALREAIKEEE